ncbi:MAG: hypothetical protein JW940_35405 [Polyangiaceae bacterium]|nr:hypothetical protein [Polyangiaceae bacterium]
MAAYRRHVMAMDRRQSVLLVGVASLALWPSLGVADELHPVPYPTWSWAALQLIPSPGLVVDRGQPAFCAQWSVTPVLYSFGMHRRLSPWRWGVVEPIVRHSGSAELRGGPDYFALTPRLGDRFGARFGIRSTWPILERGEELSWSVGTWLGWFDGKLVPGYEVGMHTLLGLFGGMMGFAPTPDGPRWSFVAEVKVL